LGIEGEEVQTKSTDNLFNRIKAENFPKFKKDRCKKLTEHKTSRTKKETPPRHIITKTLSTQNKERVQKTAKKSNKSHIKANPSE
jgi:hypothetical protein